MNTRYVWLFIAATFLIIVVFDIYLYSDGVPGNSISQVIIDAAKFPLVPFFVGFLMGGLALHWVDTYKEPRE